MWNIIKSLFRYSSKNIFSLTMLSVLLILASSVFGSLNFLSTNLNNSYDYLVNNGDLNNVVINELYGTTYIAPDGTEYTGEIAKEKNKQAFYNELDNLIGKSNYRSFEAIDFSNVNNESNGFIYKIVNNPNSEIIDKTVIYNGRNVLDQTFNFDQIIADAEIKQNSQGGIDNNITSVQARRLVLFLATKSLWTGNVSNFINDSQAILNITNPSDPKYDPANIANGKDNLAYQKINMWLNPSQSDFTPLISKGYRLAFDYAGPKATIPLVGKIDNLNAYTCVASPSTIENQHKAIISNNQLNELLKYNAMDINTNPKSIYDFNYATSNYIDEATLLDYVKNGNSENMIEVDQLRYFIVGSGISPNFMYPVYSFERQTPNIKSEALIFANDAGYNLAFDSARSAPIETYLAAKVNQDNLNSIIDEINQIAAKYMIWPSPMKAAYAINDTSNMLYPVALRVVFIPQLVATQTSISIVLSVFLLVLILMIFIFTIKKFINDLRVPLGILRANGIRKHSIVFAMPILCLIPALASGVIGYIVSQFTQTTFLSLYSFYWTIPTPIIPFSPGMFIGLLLVPFAVMSIISIIYTYFVLRGNTANLMKESINFKATPLSKLVSKGFGKSNVLAKFRASIAFSSLPKLVMITVMFSLLLVSIDVGIGLNGKFEYAKEMTFKNKKYDYAVDLIQPTIQGGQYFRQQASYPGRVVLDDKNRILNYNIGMADSWYKDFRGQTNDSQLYISGTNNFSYNNFISDNQNNINGQMLLNHLPSMNDGSWQKSDFTYLKYKMEDPAVVNSVVGVGPLSTNPWDIARNLAPMNQISLANKMVKQLWTVMFNDTNIYFNEQNLIDNGIKKDTKPGSNYMNMLNKPLNQIIKDGGFIKMTYIDPNFNPDNIPLPPNNMANNPNNDKSLVKEDTIEIYGDPNDPNLITQQWKVNYNKINNTFTINPQISVIMATLMNINNKQYTPNFINNVANQNGMNYTYLEKYKECFFNIVYSYIPMSVGDETYTKIDSLINNDTSKPISIKGIKPNSNYVILENKDNEIVNNKLKLENVNEDDYIEDANIYNKDPNDNIKSIHDLYLPTDNNAANPYFTSLINNTANYKMIINESAAIKYNLKIGDTISINPTSEATKINNFKDKTLANELNEINNKSYDFKIVDIIETYQNPEFYINQRVANFINGMAMPEMVNQSFYNEYKSNTVDNKNDWYTYNETATIKAIDPYNGLFSANKNLDLLNGLSLYSESGLAPGTDKFMKSGYFKTLIPNVMKSTKKDLKNATNQSAYISKMVLSKALGYSVNLNAKNPTQALDDAWVNVYKQDPYNMIDDLINYYGESPLLSSSIYIEPVQTFSDLFTNVSSFVNSIFVMILIIVLLLTVLSIYYLAIDFVKSAIGLISMMRAYGFKNSENVFSFLSIFFPAIIIAFAISFVAIPIFTLLQTFILNFANICLPISLQWWYVIIGLVVAFGMLAITLLIALYILKRMNAAKAITRI